MTDAEFVVLSDVVFNKIDQCFDDADFDVDILWQGSVMKLNFDHGLSIIINRHEAQQEIWLATNSNAYHFALLDGKWISRRENAELFAILATAIQSATGQGFSFDSLAK